MLWSFRQDLCHNWFTPCTVVKIVIATLQFIVSLVTLKDVLFKTWLYTNKALGHYCFCCILLFTRYSFLFNIMQLFFSQSFNNPNPSTESFHRPSKILYSKHGLSLVCTKCYICFKKSQKLIKPEPRPQRAYSLFECKYR